MRRAHDLALLHAPVVGWVDWWGAQEELVAQRFCLRVRADGPLAQAAALDPWWAGDGHGEAWFGADGSNVSFEWPPDEHGAARNPFAVLGFDDNIKLQWKLELEGQGWGNSTCRACTIQLTSHRSVLRTRGEFSGGFRSRFRRQAVPLAELSNPRCLSVAHIIMGSVIGTGY